MQDKTIVILAVRAESTNILYNSLKNDFQIKKVIIEESAPKVQLLKRRVKKLGLVKVLGQVAFRLIAVPYLKMTARKRILQLKQFLKLDDTPINKSKIIKVISVNSDKTKVILKEVNPAIVIVNGTRIIAKGILDCIPAEFLNIHTGITPLYRGVHGAYWALVENDKKACGVTVHSVDSGIDTGNILEQERIDPTKEDNFITYPLLQLATGILLLKKAIKDVLENRIEIKPYPEGASRLWSHPTLWGYIWHRVRCGVA